MCLANAATVARVWDDAGVPMADLADGTTVCAVFVGGVAVGDRVLVHCGYIVDLLGREAR